jgi:hypothetical protein
MADELEHLLAGLTAADIDPVAELDHVDHIDSGHTDLTHQHFAPLADYTNDPLVPFGPDDTPDTVGEGLKATLGPFGAVGEYGPAAMYAIYPLVDKVIPSMEVSGIVGDTNHGSGYHRSRNGLKGQGKGGDYSIQLPADRRGDGNACTAIDLKFSARDMRLVSARLMVAFKPDAKGNYDPRIECCREFFGTINGTAVTGWNRAVTGRPVGYVTSDASHLWHVHVSVFRDYATDRNRMLGLAEVLAGKPVGAFGWKDPDAKAPVVPPPPPPPPAAPEFTQVVELDAPGAGNWQCAVQNIVSGEWFIGHSRGRADGLEDTVVYRFDKSGKYQDSMTVLKGAHLYGFGVSDTNVLWLPHNEGGNDIITVQYEPGTTKTKADGTQMHVFTDNRAQVSFSPSRDWVCIWERDAHTDTYRRYAKQNVLDGLDQPKGVAVAIPRTAGRVVQGFSLVNDNLYLLLGAADAPASIEKWSFTTGKKLQTVPITQLGLLAGETGMREPEGMDGRHFGIKVLQGSARRLRILKHNL